MSSYYVYVYIDPRNFEEFYYGKGKGNRKNAYASDTSDSMKMQRIRSIQRDGLEPIVRVVAAGLKERDALLIEKTLLWKLGKTLTNISSGHYSDNFRPPNKLHLKLSGFDYNCGLFYYNVGENVLRNWDDYRRYGIISAGYGERYRDAICSFNKGDVIAAYLKRYGFVGIGRVTKTAVRIRDFRVRGTPLLECDLRAEAMGEYADDDLLCEYVAKVKWLADVDRDEAHFKSNSGLFTTPLVRASLEAQPRTISYLEQKFEIDFDDILE